MPKRNRLRRPCTFASALALIFVGANSLHRRAVASSSARAALAAAQDAVRVDIRLRSLIARATGKLTIEAGEGGGVARVTALDLPDPQTVAAGATTSPAREDKTGSPGREAAGVASAVTTTP